MPRFTDQAPITERKDPHMEKKKYQVTLFNTEGKYKPVSCIISHDPIDLSSKDNKMALIKEGQKKICMQKSWSGKDLIKYKYLAAKVREYDLEKIKAENAARYEAIKEAKYASGEWQRPKKEGSN